MATIATRNTMATNARSYKRILKPCNDMRFTCSFRKRRVAATCVSSRSFSGRSTQIMKARILQLGAVPYKSCNTLDVRSNAKTSSNENPDIPFTDFEILFLGTSAGSPSVRRNPTSICLRLSQSNWMFDCAEASLRQLMKSTIRVPMTNKFFITHLHGDHLYGLPGILCTLENHHNNNGVPSTNDRCDIAVYGPVGLYAYLTATLSTSRTRLNNLQVTVYELALNETPEQASSFEKFMRHIPKHPAIRKESIYADHDHDHASKPVWKVYDDGNVHVKAGMLQHTIASFGYVVEEYQHPGKLRPDLVLQRGLAPGPLYKTLKNGKSVRLPNGDVIQPNEVVGPPAQGRKVVIMGDTTLSNGIVDIAQNCDVLVHEATLNQTMVTEAKRRGHSTARMAGQCARNVNATMLVLTHFSHRFRHWNSADFGSMTTHSLVQEAQVSFKRRAVLAATDFLRVIVPRHPHI
uniref:Uncharacterized protein AlNc14C113G6451 n=1 Tax=Albugo laibachii Nc14 TaxID=890382 RepID=F0WIR6_9STRA|nr:conserved hypothetical protein [Albugo laibachii Nc14]|eukprot:CCA21160.1 conserved hypothetical protein [Albugo laibachii Nc14]